MALLTPLSLEDARPLLREFGMELSSLRSLDAGSVNSNFRAWDDRGKSWFVRLYEEQGVHGAAREVAMSEALAAAGVPVARALCPRGAWPVHRGKPLGVAPWLEGTSLCQARVTPLHARVVGQALARVHSVTLEGLEEGRFGPRELEERLARVHREGDEQLRTLAKRVEHELRRWVPRRRQDLPRGLIHGDLFRDNVLWDGERLAALLDFESASLGAFVYDLAVTTLAWCYGDDFDAALVAAMVEGYQQVRPLTPVERECFGVEAAVAALRFATTRLTDYALRAPPGTPPRRDPARFLARLEAVERGALDLARPAPGSREG